MVINNNLWEDYDILDRFTQHPLRLLKFKLYDVITTGKHANEFLASRSLESHDLTINYLEEIDFRRNLIIFIREPKERLISGLAQEWCDLFWDTFIKARLQNDVTLISYSFNDFIKKTLLDTNCRHDPTHVAPWLHMAIKIKAISREKTLVIDFKDLNALLSRLEIQNTTNNFISFIDHKNLSINFDKEINDMINYFLRYENKHYNFLLRTK